MNHIDKEITPWRNPLVASVLESVGKAIAESYIVGGAIRDILLRLPPKMDIDLVIKGDGFDWATKLAGTLGLHAKFVPLSRDAGMGRLVVSTPKHEIEATFDLSPIQGEDIIDDLQLRDFTINALALKVEHIVERGLDKLLDPTGGESDCEMRALRACSPDIFRVDPSRIMRAFRFCSALGFEMTQETAIQLSESLEGFGGIPEERIRDELYKILSGTNLRAAWKEMYRLEILSLLFSELGQLKDRQANDSHTSNIWSHSYNAVLSVDFLIQSIDDLFPSAMAVTAQQYVKEEPAVGRSKAALLKLVAIFYIMAGEPVDDGGSTKYSTIAKVTNRTQEAFEACAKRLKLTHEETRIGRMWIEGAAIAENLKKPDLSADEVRQILSNLQDETMGHMLLLLADQVTDRRNKRSSDHFDRVKDNVVRALEYSFSF